MWSAPVGGCLASGAFVLQFTIYNLLIVSDPVCVAELSRNAETEAVRRFEKTSKTLFSVLRDSVKVTENPAQDGGGGGGGGGGGRWWWW